MSGFGTLGDSADNGDSRKRRWFAVAIVFALAAAGWMVVSRLRPSNSMRDAIQGELATDPLLTHLLERSGRTLPSNPQTEIFGLTMSFTKALTPTEVNTWAHEDPDRPWSSSTPDRWTRTAEIIYGGGGDDESQLQCFAGLEVQLIRSDGEFRTGALIVNYPITSDSCSD